MSEEEKSALVEFAKTLKWEDYIEDAQVKEALEKIRDRVKEKASSSGEAKDELDISGAARVKLVVVGDGAIGKTSLLIRYATGEFPTEYLPTVFENYTAQMKKDSDVILLHLWDTAGQEEYDRLRPLSYPGADVVLLCFSTINQASFEAIREKWAPEIHHYIPNIPHILVGTKIDLREAKHPDPNSGKFEPITYDQGVAMATEIKASTYMEVCSKTGEGVQEVFTEAVNQVIRDRSGTTSSSDGNRSSGKAPQKSKKKAQSMCMLI